MKSLLNLPCKHEGACLAWRRPLVSLVSEIRQPLWHGGGHLCCVARSEEQLLFFHSQPWNPMGWTWKMMRATGIPPSLSLLPHRPRAEQTQQRDICFHHLPRSGANLAQSRLLKRTGNCLPIGWAAKPGARMNSSPFSSWVGNALSW